MSFIHTASVECAKSELDLFEIKPTQTSIEKSLYVEVQPLAAISETSPLVFYIAGSGEHYFDLNNTLLYITCKIVKNDNTPIADGARVSLINYPIATLFNQLDVTLGDRLISQSNNLYAYRAYIETLLNYSADALSTQFTAGLFYKDTAVRIGHAQGLLSGNAKYTIERASMKVFSVPAGSSVCNQENIFLGQIPKMVILAFVDNEAFSGAYDSNPLCFKHHNVNFAALYLDAEQIPAKPFQPDFEHSNAVREYMSFLLLAQKNCGDSGIIINREEFVDGYSLFAFDLSPDQECSCHFSLIRSGNLRAEIHFSRALERTVNFIVYGLFENIIEVNQRREVLYDFL
ncbi:uncharacterized protein F54H12.2-like [Pelodytes ibericus]